MCVFTVRNMNAHLASNQSATALPPIIDLTTLAATFGIGRTTAYLLASAGEIKSLTLGTPGKHGKRMFLTESVLEYVNRRIAASEPLKCTGGTKAGGKGE